MDEIIRVEKHDRFRDETVDITTKIGINKPRNLRRTEVFHLDEFARFARPISEQEMAAPVPLHSIMVEWGLLSKTVRHQRIEKTEEWGEHTVQFVSYWYVTYRIQVPENILGG